MEKPSSSIHQPRFEAKDRISASIGETMILVDGFRNFWIIFP